MKENKPEKKLNDYNIILDVYQKLQSINTIINKIKPNTTTCNRLLNYIYNDTEFDNSIKITYINTIIEYIEKQHLIKDRGYYQVVIQCLTLSNDANKQYQLLQEMNHSGLIPKVSTYIPIIKSYNQLFKSNHDKKTYDMVFKVSNDIIINNMSLNEDVFKILFDTMQYANTAVVDINIKSDLINTLKLLSYYIDIMGIDCFKTYIEFINSFANITMSEFKIPYMSKIYQKYGLTQRVLTNETYDNMKDEWIKSFSEDEKLHNVGDILRSSISNFKFHNKKFIDATKKIVLIDAANIGYAINRKRSEDKTSFYRQIDAFVQYFHKLGWNVIIFIYINHVNNIDVKDIEIQTIVNSWRQPYKNIVRYDVKDCNDDYIWMLASFYYNSIRPNHDVYILTNDIMRNPNIDKLNQKDFFQFQKNHQILYDINYTYNNKLGYSNSKFNIEVHMPISYGHFTQFFETEQKLNIYVPYFNNVIKKNERDVKMMNLLTKFKNELEIVTWCHVELTLD